MIKVNWDALPEEANYVAMQYDGHWHWFLERPTYDTEDSFWLNDDFNVWGWGAVPSSAILNAKGVEPKNSLIQKENVMTKKRHVHADLIIAWAEGAEIEFRVEKDGLWELCYGAPIWDADTEYRIKQKTITKSVTFPEPMLTAPKIGQMYWVITGDKIYEYAWENSYFDNDSLLKGLVHFSEENAKLHLAAVRAVKYPFENA